MTKTTRNPAPRPTAARVIYEIRPTAGRVAQVEATSAADLAGHLARVAGLDPYGSRAAAHVLYVLKGRVESPEFSARRLGVMAFTPDAPTPPQPPRKAQEAQRPGERPSTPEQHRAEPESRPEI